MTNQLISKINSLMQVICIYEKKKKNNHKMASHKKSDSLKTNRIFLQLATGNLDIDMYFYQCQNCLRYTCKSSSDHDIFQNTSYNHYIKSLHPYFPSFLLFTLPRNSRIIKYPGLKETQKSLSCHTEQPKC